jgi:ABC-type lipoprotein release transport system permease subunit
MPVPYEWLIGVRYLRSTHRSGFVSFVASMSVIGLSLGVAVLIVVLSVLNGFESELRSRMLTVTAHATITGVDGAIPDWRARQATAAQEPGVKAAVPFIESRGLLANGQRVSGVVVRGVLPEEEVKAVGLGSRLTSGSLSDLEAGKYRIVLGAALAEELGVKPGQTVVLMAPEGSVTPAGFEPRKRRFTVAGIFDSGMYEFDRGLVLLHMTDAARLYQMGDDVTGLRLALNDPFLAPMLVRTVARAIDVSGNGYFISDWTRDHREFLPHHRAHQVDDVLHPADPGGGRGHQPDRHAGDDRQGKADRYRHPAHHRRGAGQRAAHVPGAGRAHRAGGHGAGALLGWLLSRELPTSCTASRSCSAMQVPRCRVYLMSDLPHEVQLATCSR